MNISDFHDNKDIFTKIFLASVGLIGFLLIIAVTSQWGIGLSPDSAGYLAGARNIVNGKGISLIYDSDGNILRTWLPWRDHETSHLFTWPPFFPLVLSIFGFLKLDLLVAGRFLIAAIFGANVFLITFIVRKYLKSTFLMVLAAILLITSRHMIWLHTMLWSEPLFILLSLLGLILLIYFLEKKKILFLLTASIFFSLAFLTRTIGISLIAVMVLTLLLFSDLKIKNKIIYSAISIFIGILPFSIWILVNKFTYGTAPAEFIFHPFPFIHYFRTLNVISMWIMPAGTPVLVRILLIIVFMILAVFIAAYIILKNKKKNMDEQYRSNSKIIGIFSFHIFFYFVALVSASYFFNAAINIGDFRLLLPFLISIFIVSFFFLKRVLDYYHNEKNVKIIIYVFCGFLIATSFMNNTAIQLYQEGKWYSSESWSQSETIKELEKFKQNPIYTDDPAAIYLLLGRNPNYLPTKFNIHTGRTNSDLQEDLDKTMEEIIEKDGIIVFFDDGFYDSIIQEKELTKVQRLELIKNTPDGAIYKIID